jgi:hypothetical protein
MTIVHDYTAQIKSILDKCEVTIPVINNAEPLVSTEEPDVDILHIENKYINIETMISTLPLSDELKQLYYMIGSQDKEYNINGWAILSLNDVCNDHELMKEYTDNNIVDFARLYVGMGHYYMCAYDPRTSNYFVRRDGGSSGHDRELNFNFFCTYVAQEDKHFDFQYLLDIFNDIYNLNHSHFKMIEN